MKGMANHWILRPVTVSILVAAATVLSACGSEPSSVDSGASEPGTTSVTAVPGSDSELASNTSADTAAPTGALLAANNIGGEVFGGRVHQIDSLEIAESYPEQLQIRFTAGAEPCMTADATATVVGDEIVVQLVVGVAENVAAMTCVQGEFAH